jgi:2-dehydropantoate 2-reductase
MPNPMKFTYAIIGTGAIGGFYGARLQRAGAEVHFLVHSDWRSVAEHGLTIDSRDGDFSLPHVNAYRAAADMPACDMAVVALKTTQNHLLPAILPHLLDDHGRVLLLQNGFGEEEAIARIPGVTTIVAGLCFICAAKIGPGHIQHQDYGAVRLGQFTADNSAAGETPLMQALAADFGNAGIQVELESDLCLARWKKLVWNIPFSGLTTVLNADTRKVITAPASRDRAIGLMREVAAAAAGDGRDIDDAFVKKMIRDTESMTPYFPSMKLDYDAGRELEIGSMYAHPLAAARRAGVDTPLIAALYAELRALPRRSPIGRNDSPHACCSNIQD